MARTTLRRRVLAWLLGYVVLLAVGLSLAGYFVHERAERLVWRALLESELDQVVARSRHQALYTWQDSDTLSLYRSSDADALPAPLRGLQPGLHDSIEVAGKNSAVLVRDIEGMGRLIMVLDITDFEDMERSVTHGALAAIIVVLLISGLMAMTGMGMIIRPLTRLAEGIGLLRPEAPRQRVVLDPRASAELEVIALALNDYLARNERFVERERSFLHTASHELRTPISVILGATGLLLEQPGLSPQARAQAERAHRTAVEVEQLIGLLLVLARDPGRLASISDEVALERVLPELVGDHGGLTQGKALQLVLGPMTPQTLWAPLAMVRAAVGNLLRNAIEHSDNGQVRVSVLPGAVVVIEDPGHGAGPEEISRIHARLARGGQISGIGLDLITRLCEHLGWTLHFEHTEDGRGTRAVLGLAASLSKVGGT